MCEITSCCDISFINCELCTILSCWMLAHLTLNKEQNVLPEACNDYFNLFSPHWLCRTHVHQAMAAKFKWWKHRMATPRIMPLNANFLLALLTRCVNTSVHFFTYIFFSDYIIIWMLFKNFVCLLLPQGRKKILIFQYILISWLADRQFRLWWTSSKKCMGMFQTRK